MSALVSPQYLYQLERPIRTVVLNDAGKAALGWWAPTEHQTLQLELALEMLDELAT